MILTDVKVFVISLVRAQERLKKFSDRCLEIGQSYEIFEAIDGTTLQDGLISRYHLGCFLSHVNLWKYILESGLDYACILEDDAFILEPLKNIECTEGFDILFLSKRIYLNDQNVLIGYGTEGYLVSKKGCEQLLKIDDPTVPLDLRILAHIENYEMRCVEFFSKKNPDVLLVAYKSKKDYIAHLSGFSYIENKHMDNMPMPGNFPA